ncbi:hypothetical protein BKA62DRAFT_700068, partial [Auriculariales sp. MPI-PUGE-AT-0066]
MARVAASLLFLFASTFLAQHGARAFGPNNSTSVGDFEDVEFEPQGNLTRRACPPGAQECPTGDCCAAGTFCVALDAGFTKYTCASDRLLSNSQPPAADTNGACADGWQKCSTGGCCGSSTTCTPTNVDDGSSAQVCLAPTWPEGIPAGSSSVTTADNDGKCGDGQTLCGGKAGAGCCAGGSGCLPKNALQTAFVCASARTIPGAAQPMLDCPSDATPCSDTGCCAAGKLCQPIDYTQSKWVCASSTFKASFGVAPQPESDKPASAVRLIAYSLPFLSPSWRRSFFP